MDKALRKYAPIFVIPTTAAFVIGFVIPFIEGQDPEVTVIINGHITKIKKGHQVKVTKAVASVLENSNQQMMVAYENQQKLKNQYHLPNTYFQTLNPATARWIP